MLRVSYKNRIGYYTATEKWPDEPAKRFKIWMCPANVSLWADMNFYKVTEEYERFGKKYKKGDKMAQLCGFFDGATHLKRCIQDGIYENANHFHFYADRVDAEIWKGIRVLLEAGKTVTFITKKKK